MKISSLGRCLVNRLGFALMFLAAALTVSAAFFPGRWQIGPVLISLRSMRNPLAATVLGYVLWRMTYDGFGQWFKRRIRGLENYGDQLGVWSRRVGRRFVAVWLRWGWRERLIFTAVASQTFFALHFWQDYPAYLENEHQAIDNLHRMPTYELNGHRLPVVESFSRRLCAEVPADARILFHGHTAGLRLAYEVYPRQVFMLPQEMRTLAASWHVQPELGELPADRKAAYWQERLPEASIDERQFIAEHHINYVVTFDEYDLAKCRVEPAR
jgi:hypothetical protein